MEKTILAIRENFDKYLSEMICKKVNHQDHCYDILQEVYVKLIQNIDKIEKVTNLRSYLFRIADNAIADHYRKKNIKSETEFFEEILFIEPEGSNDSLKRFAECCLRPFVESLEPKYSEALLLTELSGLTQKQYAERVGISLTNAKSRVQRAKKKLKEAILTCCSYKFDKFGNIISCCE